MKDYDQKPLWIEKKAQYVNIFEYYQKTRSSTDPDYALDDFTTDRKLRSRTRDLMVKDLMTQFYFFLRK